MNIDLIYIYHSGYAILGEGLTIIIDYYKDSVSDTDGIVHQTLLSRPGKLYVLSSHFHADHFNYEIMKWKELRNDITYILSKDIAKRRKIDKSLVNLIKKGDVFCDKNITVKAYGSTDVGVSFLIQLSCDGKRIFHAGDLNNWHWMEESEEPEWKGYENNFLKELDDIYKDYNELDLVMFPVDPRLGKEYQRGARQFTEKIKTKVFMPMHFRDDYKAANTFQDYANNIGIYSPLIREKGQYFSSII